MDDASLVVYHGPNAEAVAERWVGTDRPFELVAATTDDGFDPVLAERDIDCVVIDGGADPLAVLDRVRATFPSLPVVVFGTDGVTPAAALERGVTHFVDGDRDRTTVLESLAPVVDRHRRERRERTMLSSLLENIPLSVYFKDRKSRYVRVSDAMLTLLDKPYLENPEGKRFSAPADVVGTSEFDLFPAGAAEGAVADDRTVIETEESIDNTIEHVYGSVVDGTYVATSKAPWYDEHGNVVGLLGVTRDVSERKQYEHRLERQNERLERFAHVVSHDLRNPLEVARGRLELAREDPDDGEHYDAIERSLDRMDDLIDDVLALARQGDAVENPESVELETVARDAWSVVDTDGATLVVDADRTVEGDPGRLRQLFENLFRNAVEHGSTSNQQAPDAVEHGGRETLTITVSDVEGGRGFVVADDGQGIPEKAREEIFEAGYTTGESGAGLGLNIVRTIADAHGWDVTAGESDAGGAAFTFEIPR